jgi:DNA-directed RNA polymerase specialized sigma24 family protein
MSRNFTPDETLIDRLLLDDTEAFEELHRRYCYSLYKYCMEKLDSPVDAKRITRDIFIAIWENRHRLPVGFSISLHLYSEVRRAVVRCVNEKLLDKEAIPVIAKQIIPGFSVEQLQKARQPVTSKQRKTQDVSTAQRSITPWWNRYPHIPEMRGLKHVFRDMLNFLKPFLIL